MRNRERGPPTVELWTSDERAPEDGPQAAIEQRLDDLRAAGAIADYEVRVWGRTVTLDRPTAEEARDTARERTIRDRVRAFDGWFVHHGRGETPFPPARQRGLGRDGGEVVQPLPDLVVAAYAGGDLLWVGECGDEDCDPTVVERLDALADGTGADRPERDTPEPAVAD